MLKSLLKVAAVLCALAITSTGAQAADTSLGNVSVPSSITYSQTYTSGIGAFVDNYTFTITGASADSVSSTINLSNVLGISGLQAVFFSGGPASLGSLLETSWVSSINVGNTTVSTAILNPITLAAGTYTLQVSGSVLGTSGGSYSGVLNLAPVPEPESYAMLLGGLGLLGLMVRRRKNEKD